MTSVQALRNMAFVGHPSSGKTTLVDALAFKVGASARKGSVADKTSICDTEPEEQEKGHTLQLAVVQAEKDDCVWTWIDTPGYPDFVGDVHSAMYAADLVVGVLSCTGPVTFNLRKKMRTAQEIGRGRMIVATHVDGENVDFDAEVEEMRERIGKECVPIALPDKSGPGFSAVTPVLGGEPSDWRKRLMDRVMDACEDEDVLMEYMETETVSDEVLHAQLPNAIAKGTLVPVFPVNPQSGTGIDEFYEFLKEYAPHPGLRPARTAEGEEIPLDPEGALCGTVFHVHSDPHVGRVAMVRIHRGTLGAHDQVVGDDGDKPEKLGGLFRVVGKKRDNVETAKPGEIVAFSKVEHVPCGHSFAHPGEDLVRAQFIDMPTPMVALAIHPKSRADEQKIGEALTKLKAEDMTFTVDIDPNTREMVAHGMSELHLGVMEARLKRRFGVEIETTIPRISYKETVTKKAEGHYRHKKQSGGRGQFGECYVRVKPLEKGAGLTFTDSIVGGSIPRNLIPAIEKGMREIASEGVLTHSQVVDLDFEVYDGKYHDVDSDEASFKIAGARAFMDGFNKAGPVLLEPVMELTISVPTDSAGTIFSDITSQRRGSVMDQWNEEDGAVTVIKAQAPLATVQTYQRDLKSQTAGEGHYTMTMVDYQPVPTAEQAKILAQTSKKHDED